MSVIKSNKCNNLTKRLKSVFVENTIDSKYYTLDNAPAIKKAMEDFKSLPLSEQQKIRDEVMRECGLNQ